VSTIHVEIDVNGQPVARDIEPRILLIHYLRDHAGVRSPRVGCDTTSCGACTVLLDDRPVKSCTLLAAQADRRRVRTAESLSSPGEPLHTLQQAFWDEHGLQCGYCTAGIMMAALELVEGDDPAPTEEEVREAISGNICRCTGYVNIVKAVLRAAEVSRAQQQ
jgi:carbon-monoxide dehydrogenase small subunit